MGKFFTTLYFTPSYKNLNNLVVGIFSTLFTHLLADLSPATWGQILLKIFLESAAFFISISYAMKLFARLHATSQPEGWKVADIFV